ARARAAAKATSTIRRMEAKLTPNRALKLLIGSERAATRSRGTAMRAHDGRAGRKLGETRPELPRRARTPPRPHRDKSETVERICADPVMPRPARHRRRRLGPAGRTRLQHPGEPAVRRPRLRHLLHAGAVLGAGRH